MGERCPADKMSETKREYAANYRKPPLRTRFKKERSGNPGGRSKKKLHALLAVALSEPVFVTVDGERRKITKREAVVHQLVNKSAAADLRATKMLFDMIKEVEQKASVTPPVPQLRRLDAADKEVVQNFVDRIRQQILAEMAAKSIEVAGAECPAENEPKTKPLSAL
jgi:cell fate (sporulation/competence/biofilm development) regulator YmcA (YheA/YmcA/DUF963 family)